jgi:hypothetical protein
MTRLTHALAAAAAGALLAAPAAEARKDTTKLSRGATELTLDAGVLSALQGAGVSVSAARPATATASGAVRLPITRGRLSAAGEGRIDHVGGIVLAKGDTRVVVRNLRIRLDEDGSTLSGKVRGRRLVLADLGGASIATEGRRVTITGITATLTSGGAAALNDALGTSLEAGATLGTATVTTSLRGKGARPKRERGDDDARKGRRGSDDDGGERRGKGHDKGRGKGHGRGHDD